MQEDGYCFTLQLILGKFGRRSGAEMRQVLLRCCAQDCGTDGGNSGSACVGELGLNYSEAIVGDIRRSKVVLVLLT